MIKDWYWCLCLWQVQYDRSEAIHVALMFQSFEDSDDLMDFITYFTEIAGRVECDTMQNVVERCRRNRAV